MAESERQSYLTSTWSELSSDFLQKNPTICVEVIKSRGAVIAWQQRGRGGNWLCCFGVSYLLRASDYSRSWSFINDKNINKDKHFDHCIVTGWMVSCKFPGYSGSRIDGIQVPILFVHLHLQYFLIKIRKTKEKFSKTNCNWGSDPPECLRLHQWVCPLRSPCRSQTRRASRSPRPESPENYHVNLCRHLDPLVFLRDLTPFSPLRSPLCPFSFSLFLALISISSQ